MKVVCLKEYHKKKKLKKLKTRFGYTFVCLAFAVFIGVGANNASELYANDLYSCIEIY